MNTLKEIAEKIAWHESELSKLKEIIRDESTIEALKINASHVFNIDASEITSTNREREYVLARNAIIYIMRYVFGYGPSELGQLLNRHHSTIISSSVVFLTDMTHLKGYKEDIDKLMEMPIK